MANPYFNLNLEEQDSSLIYDLSDEAHFNWGIEIEYLPRDVTRADPILNEPLSSQFNRVYQLDAIIESHEAFFAGNESFGTVGLTFNFSSSSLSISRRQFIALTGQSAPYEGDLVFIKANKMLFEVTNVNARDPLISGGRQYTFVIYLQPFKAGEGSSTFNVKGQTSSDFDKILECFIERTDQTAWNGNDASSDEITCDSILVRADDDEVGIGEIFRCDSTEITADSELTAADTLGIWDDTAVPVLEMMDDRLPEYADNEEFECAGEKILIDQKTNNPFGFE